MSTIGFIGLGRMGRPMSTNLCRKGFKLLVHDVNMEAVRELEKVEARAATPIEMAAGCDIIVTMLPNSEIVRELFKLGAIAAFTQDEVECFWKTLKDFWQSS